MFCELKNMYDHLQRLGDVRSPNGTQQRITEFQVYCYVHCFLQMSGSRFCSEIHCESTLEGSCLKFRCLTPLLPTVVFIPLEVFSAAVCL